LNRRALPKGSSGGARAQLAHSLMLVLESPSGFCKQAAPVTKRSPSTSWSSANGRTQPAGRLWCLFSVGRDRRSTVPGLLPLPISSLKSGFPVLGNPANRNRAVPLNCFGQFLYAFANAVSETRGSSCTKPTECRHLANHCSKQPRPTRTTPSAPAAHHLRGEGPYRAAVRRQPPTSSRTTRRHRDHRDQEPWTALTIHSWREVADTALAFVNDSPSRAGADPSKRYAYAPTMAGHRDIGLRTRDDDRFLRRRTEFLSQRGRVASRSRMIRARPRRVGR
jgi:hypothetical protein